MVTKNQELRAKVVTALMDFYWNNDIDPDETAIELRSIADFTNGLVYGLEQTSGTVEPASAEPPLEQTGDTCPYCKGKRYVSLFMDYYVKCNRCKGTGQV